MFTFHFWQLTAERALKTFAQSLLAILSADGVGLLTVPWLPALSTAGAAALLSVLTSMTSAPLGEPNSPSLLPVHPVSAPVEAKASVPAS
ncbi:MAG: holin [Pseudonocardiaceae bacterium]